VFEHYREKAAAGATPPGWLDEMEAEFAERLVFGHFLEGRNEDALGAFRALRTAFPSVTGDFEEFLARRFSNVLPRRVSEDTPQGEENPAVERARLEDLSAALSCATLLELAGDEPGSRAFQSVARRFHEKKLSGGALRGLSLDACEREVLARLASRWKVLEEVWRAVPVGLRARAVEALAQRQSPVLPVVDMLPHGIELLDLQPSSGEP
jgi:hypothetical protein